MYQHLKQLNMERIDVDEAVALVTYGRQLKAGFESYQVDAPAWLTDNIEALDKEIKSKRRDMLAARLAQAKSRLDALKTADEKRADLKAEIERLSAALA